MFFWTLLCSLSIIFGIVRCDTNIGSIQGAVKKATGQFGDDVESLEIAAALRVEIERLTLQLSQMQEQHMSLQQRHQESQEIMAARASEIQRLSHQVGPISCPPSRHVAFILFLYVRSNEIAFCAGMNVPSKASGGGVSRLPKCWRESPRRTRTSSTSLLASQKMKKSLRNRSKYQKKN